jgi:TolB-like protein
MIFLINFLNNRACILLLAVFLLAGCAQLEQLEQEKPEPLAMLGMDVAWQEGPQTARLGSLRCSIRTSGGSGKVTFELQTLKGGIATIEHSGEESTWSWSPKEPGIYRVKTTATDDTGASVDSSWSAEYRFDPPVDAGSLYAVLPVDNISAAKAPLAEIHQALINALTEKGFQILAHETLDDFMEKNRVRYTGGLNSEIGRKLQEELGVEGVFITSLETWQDGSPPRVSLVSRVDLPGEWPEILWIDSVGLTGDDAPGLLGIGRIKSAEQLLAKGVDSLVNSFQLYLAGGYPTYRAASDRQEMRMVNSANSTADFFGTKIERRHQPRFTYRAPDYDPAGRYSVAVVPFLNVDVRKYAGEVVALHFVKQLSRYENLRVVEPGLVRQIMLDYRMIMEAGPSLANSDILASENILGADIVFSGKVFDYQGTLGMSKVDFSVQAFDGKKREVVWTSRSYATGDEGVYFFAVGRVPSAHGLTTRMSKAVVDLLEE